MPKLSPEGSRPLANVLAATRASPEERGDKPPANPQVRDPEERGEQPNGVNPAPTNTMTPSRATAAPMSSMERAMGDLADKMHPVKRK